MKIIVFYIVQCLLLNNETYANAAFEPSQS